MVGNQKSYADRIKTSNYFGEQVDGVLGNEHTHSTETINPLFRVTQQKGKLCQKGSESTRTAASFTTASN